MPRGRGKDEYEYEAEHFELGERELDDEERGRPPRRYQDDDDRRDTKDDEEGSDDTERLVMDSSYTLQTSGEDEDAEIKDEKQYRYVRELPDPGNLRNAKHTIPGAIPIAS